MRVPVPAALAAALIVVGCVSVSRSVLTRQYESQPVPRDDVFVLLASAGDSIPSTCSRVAVLHASGAEMASEGKIMDKLRDEAGKLGANTVFIQNMEEPGAGERIVGALIGTGADKDSDALALRCPPPSEAGALSAPRR